MESVSTHESTGVSGVHVLITDDTRPLICVLRRGVDRGRGLGHGRQWWAWFGLWPRFPSAGLGSLPGLDDGADLVSNGVQRET